MDKFFSRKRKFDDNKASTSAQASIVPKIKSRKYSQEYLNFGFTITVVNGEEKALCVICSKILAADTRCKKPDTIGEELILPAAIEIVETMFGDNFAKELQSIPLSNDTVSRRIHDVAEDIEQQLFASAHAENEDVNELLRHCCPFVLQRQSARIVTGGKVRAAKRLPKKIPYMLDGIEIPEIMPANPYVQYPHCLRAVRPLLCDDMVHCRP
ncbi:SCAN domain-containing protein 3 [Trichonephila clavipes]|uniref:SCAN domain-containing protein 3 n=1 Tax=Trichonephila clavipes TaxID=2585209 RepID=A0A8X6VGB9_TRICX|nr:SCAN domain-containing protein 3 [Trichonephila clavipes]